MSIFNKIIGGLIKSYKARPTCSQGKVGGSVLRANWSHSILLAEVVGRFRGLRESVDFQQFSS